MKNKNKKKILRFISIFSIISILFVAFSFPISALDIGGGATLTGLYSHLWVGEGNSSSIYYEDTTVTESNNSISFSFNISNLSDLDQVIMTNYCYYSFDSSNYYGTITFSIKTSGGHPAYGIVDKLYLFNSLTNEQIPLSSDSGVIDNGPFTISYTGYIPSKFYIYSVWLLYPWNYPTPSIVSYDLKFTPGNPVADKLEEEAYPSFEGSQDTLDDSQVIEDDSLNKANGFIDNTADFVFDRSLWTEGNFINGLRVASTTFENFASIPFIGTILKYAVIFGLIGFVLGLATFVMRRRK